MQEEEEEEEEGGGRNSGGCAAPHAVRGANGPLDNAFDLKANAFRIAP